MGIGRILLMFLFLSVILAGGVMGGALLLRTLEHKVLNAQERRFESYQLADELRQSSDDLTRFARTYAATGEEKFERYFWRILDIRNGLSVRPEGYERIFWDFVAADTLPEPTADSAGARSLQERMKQAGVSDAEFAKLREAQQRSDELVNLERVALNAIKGRFDDGAGGFTRVGEPDRGMAIALLHGDRYHAAKAQIMGPIDEFMTMIDQRTAEELRALNRQSERVLTLVIAMSILLLAAIAAMVVTLHFRLVRRSTALMATVEKIGAGDLSARTDISGQDEIGVLGKAIDSMAGNLTIAIAEARQNAEEVTRRDHEQAEQANLTRVSRLTTMGTMTASIAHEINQPLAAMVTNANAALRWLSREEPEIDEVRASLKNIVRDGKRASEVIGSVRSMFKKEDTRHEPHDLNTLTKEVLRLLRTELWRNEVSVQVEWSDDLPPFIGDRVQVQQVIMNLIMNAIEAMSPVTYRARVLTLKTALVDGDSVSLDVLDTGGGIAPDVLEKLFQPFVTTKAQGMGLGLSICRSIVEAHGGRLSAHPRTEQGVAMRVVLPAGDR